jgi:hypothetical protein
MKQKKIIYADFSLERTFIVDYLSEKYQWDPIVFIDHDKGRSQREAHYPEALFLHPIKLRQGQFDYSKLGKPIPIDAEIITALSKYERNVFNTIQDTNNHNYTDHEKRSFYYDLLNYWNTLVHYLEPEIFVHFTWPHDASSYSLYLICKHYYKIDVLFISPIAFFNIHTSIIDSSIDKYTHIIGDSLDSQFSPFIKFYESSEDLSPSIEVSEYLSAMRGEQATANSMIMYEWEDEKRSPIFRLSYFIKLIIKTLLSGYGFKQAEVSWKKNRKPYYLPCSRMNHLEYFLFEELLRNKNKRLLKYYKPLCVEPNFNKKYIYFAAPYQPEAVTSTNAGVYDDIMLAVNILSSILPDDWVIYYKENPMTFGRGVWLQGALERDKYYFQRLDSYKNIKLVSSDVNSFKLIDGAQAVATVSGTVAWEAAVRGKPALSFGSAWYMGCQSIFWIKTLQDAQIAMEKIVGGWKPEQTDINRYAAAIEKIAVKDLIHFQFHENINKCDDPKYEMERIGEALYEAYERLCANN